MNATPAADKVKACCTSLACGRVLLINAAKWKDRLPCPLCKKGTLVKFESTKTPMVPVVPVRAISNPNPKPAAPPRIDEVPIVPVRVIPDPKPAAPARTESVPVVPVRVIPDPLPHQTESVPIVPVRVIPDPQPAAALPRVDGVPVATVRHIPDTATGAEWLPTKTVAPPAPPMPTPTAVPVPTVTLAETEPLPVPPQLALELVDAILVGELAEEEADAEAAPSGTYGVEGVRTPPLCPKCKTNLQPNTERCPGCAFDFRGDWERRLLDQDKLRQELNKAERRQAEVEAERHQQEKQDRLQDLVVTPAIVSIWTR